jgi:substrate import-associated zinc metallohydrolase lipoprotein
MKLSKILLLIMVLSISTSCSNEEELDTSFLNLESDYQKGPIDDWLHDNFVVPYNIEVKYRFDRYELALNRMLVPPKEEKIIPVMETIKKTWIDVYEEVAGSTFIKRLSPKQFVLVGSPEVNPNGTITLGTAEGGRKIVLYKLNDFDKSDKPEVKQMLHTIQHEFAHILHQTVMYPQEYRTITSEYTASWNDYSLSDARSRGFITQYARSSPDEDFVEMISIMLIEGKSGFDNIINSTPASIRPKFRQKEQMIVDYFKNTWNINIYDLQKKAIDAINSL